MARTRSKNNKLEKFGKIAVLAGGPSNEREISLRSGKAVYKALKNTVSEIEFLDVSENAERDIRKLRIDTAFIALHGRFGEDGAIQRILEKLGVSYTGSGVLASQLALDKIASRKIFERKNIPVPEYRIFKKNAKNKPAIRFPVVVKPQFEGSSIGLSIVDKEGSLKPALKRASKYGKLLIVEEFIKGREITVGILGTNALPPLEIIPKRSFYDFFAKYKSRDTQYLVPAPLPKRAFKRAKDLALSAHNALGCRGFSRVDMRLAEDGEFYVLEVNSIPGLTAKSLLPKAAAFLGISFKDLCIKILNEAFKKRSYNG